MKKIDNISDRELYEKMDYLKLLSKLYHNKSKASTEIRNLAEI